MITKIDQITSDIDWFFTDGVNIGFVASNTGKLPNSVAEKTFEELEFLSLYFSKLPIRCNAKINPILKLTIPDIDRKKYFGGFVEMAEKGVYAYDKKSVNNWTDTDYTLIASPQNPLKLSDISINITNLICKTKLNSDIVTTLNICMID